MISEARQGSTTGRRTPPSKTEIMGSRDKPGYDVSTVWSI